MFSNLDWSPVLDLLKNKDISGWFKSNEGGQYLREFQHKFAQFLGAKHALAVSSGSASIYIALRACGVEPGDFVAVPAYTHIGSVAPIMLVGARPLFVDVDKYGNMDPVDLQSIPKTYKAVIVVHQLGLPCDMDNIRMACDEAFIIEDASHALGSEYKSKKAGILGDIGCFSIGGGRTKTIGTGEGGIIVTNSDVLAERCKNMRNHGDRNFDVDYFCFNFRMAELNALVGLVQMDKLNVYIDWQINNARYLLENLPKYLEAPTPPPNVKTVWYLIGCRFRKDETKISRDDFLKQVVERGFEGGIPRRNIGKGYAKLISEVKYYAPYYRKLPMSERIRDEAVWIDWHRYPRTKDEINELISVLKEIEA